MVGLVGCAVVFDFVTVQYSRPRPGCILPSLSLHFACHEPSSCFASHTVDDATVAFIRGWMLHLVKGIMDKPHQVAKPHELTSHPTTTSSKPAGFVFNSCYTPNVRDKVAWVPEKNAWQLYVKHPTDDSETRQFVVNPDQPSDDYEQQKTDAYCRAVNAWNRLDGTKRHRIPEVIASQKCD